MAKNLKLTIKNTQIAEAINMGSLKNKLAKKKESSSEEITKEKDLIQGSRLSESSDSLKTQVGQNETAPSEAPRVKARSRSVFSEAGSPEIKSTETKSKEIKAKGKETLLKKDENEGSNEEDKKGQLKAESGLSNPFAEEISELKQKTGEELRKEIFKDDLAKNQDPAAKHETEKVKSDAEKSEIKTFSKEQSTHSKNHPAERAHGEKAKEQTQIKLSEKVLKADTSKRVDIQKPSSELEKKPTPAPFQKAYTKPIIPIRNIREEHAAKQAANLRPLMPLENREPIVKLGPTGKHMRDLAPPPRKITPKPETTERSSFRQGSTKPAEGESSETAADKQKNKAKTAEFSSKESEEDKAKGLKSAKSKEFRDVKPTRRNDSNKSFDVRDRQGLRGDDERGEWRKRRHGKQHRIQEDVTIRPTSLKVRVPISIKDLAAQMKLKSSQLIAKLFLQGSIMTLNDLLDDEVILHMLGAEFGCEVTIDSSEEERIRITDKTVKEEIAATTPESLVLRPPIVAFMGHVDHGKTSLIDYIRNSNRAAGEAGAITQHIGAFRSQTKVGPITILDTPGHEAFSAMRARGADVTDIVVLVVAGDEGIRQQTIEAIFHAKAAKVTIVVAINKCDKPNFNAENVYRQLAEQDLLPESWGGQTITVNCSATTGEGIPQLLEMLALQAEILELKANPATRARGTVLESEMHKGMGSVATVLVQNGTLKIGDAIVFNQFFGRVKTIQDEFGNQLQEAPPSAPVSITGLSGLPEAGQEFITVKSEKEAREISEARILEKQGSNLLLKKKVSMENLLQQSSEASKKVLNIVLRADVQGSLEALKVALQKIESDKADLNIIFTGVGEVSESDAQLAAASKAVIIGFHTHIESHADLIVKQLGVQVRLHDIIYHAIDDVKDLMAGLLDKIAIEKDIGKAEVRATFKSSHHGIIAGCYVTEGAVQRNNSVRVIRNKLEVHKGQISSLKRVKEDVKEVLKGLECGIILNNFELQEGDILETYEITYMIQKL